MVAAVLGDRLDGRALAHLDRDRFGLELGGVADELRDCGALGHETGAPERGHEDRGGLRPELGERAVAVLAHAEVDLRGGREPVAFDDVDEQRELHAPAFDERERLEHLAPSGVLAGQWLHEARELGEQRRDEWARHELGHASAAVRLIVQRSSVEPLDERDVGLRQEWTEQRGHEVRAEVADVGVEPAEEVASAASSDFHIALPLPDPGPVSGEHGLGRDHAGALPGRDCRGGVRRAVVEHEHLVDEATSSIRVCAGPWRRCGRPWPPRSAPAGRPRPSGPAPPWPAPARPAGSRHGARAPGAGQLEVSRLRHLGLRRRFRSGHRNGHEAWSPE